MGDSNYSRAFFVVVAVGVLVLLSTHFIFFQSVGPSAFPTPGVTPVRDVQEKTHRNDRAEFEVKYPADWKIVTEQNSFLAWPKDSYEEMIKRENSEGAVPDFSVIVYDSFADFLEKNKYLQSGGQDIFEFYRNAGTDIKNVGETVLDGQEAVMAERVFFQDQVIVVAEKEGKVYELAMRGLLNTLSDTQRDVFDSFKFIEFKEAHGPIIYKNKPYGFTLELPQDWAEYTVKTESWHGYDVKTNDSLSVYSGPQIILRHSRWMIDKPWQDIVVMVFTVGQWEQIEDGKISVNTAPFIPSRLGQKGNFVFALPPRWAGFTEALGQEEAKKIAETFKFIK